MRGQARRRREPPRGPPAVGEQGGDGPGPDPDNPSYVPTTWPGARLPHVWLNDGTALHDRLGPGYTLLRLGKTRNSTSALEESFRKLRVPLDILEIPDENAREILLYDLLLIRPDLHIVWRGNTLPHDVDKLALVATGHL